MTAPTIQREDTLGSDFTAETIPLRPDDEGPVDATLVRRVPMRQRRAILYVHGFIDYFFHPHVAQAAVDHDYDFYALDLRKYGRSLHDYQTPNYTTDLAVYDEELDRTIDIIRGEGHDVVVVMAHSTGGLIVPLWMNRRRAQQPVDALILDSPFFDLNGTAFERGPFTKIVDRLGRIAPKFVLRNDEGFYAKALHRNYGGEWDFNLTWKTTGPFKVRAGWTRTVRRGHAQLNAGLNLEVPILVCASARSGDGKVQGPHLADADCVLNVEHMVAGAKVIGTDVTLVRIDGGIHDLALSRPAVRQRYLDEVFAWAATHVPASR